MMAIGGADAAHSLLVELRSADPQVRWRAVTGLARTRTLEVALALAKALHDPEPFVRWAAAQALGKLAGSSAERAVPVAVSQAVLDATLADEPGVRAAAADVVAAWGGGGPLDPLLTLAQDAQPAVRAAAVRALGLAGGGALQVVTPALLRALEDGDPEVRRVAANAVAWCRDGSAAAALVARLGDPVGPVRAAAVRALARVSAGEYEEAALLLLQDADPAVRVEAIRFLRRWGSQPAVEALAALEEDSAPAGDATVGDLAAEARRHVARRQQRWRGWFLRWRERRRCRSR